MRFVAQDSRESPDQSRDPLIGPPLGEALFPGSARERTASEAPPRGRSHHRRGGFTLIEILLVLAIIATLAALLLAAVFRANVFAQFVGGTKGVADIGTALENFKQKFGVYPPSRIKLCKRYVDYNYWATSGQMDPLSTDSIFYLSKLAPRITDSTSTTPAAPTGQTKSPWMCLPADPTTVANQDYIDWDGSGTYTPPAGGPAPAGTPPGYIVLEGDQCLVFFLGGMILGTGPITTPITLDGFSQDPFNPAKPRQSQSEQRTSFYPFDGSR